MVNFWVILWPLLWHLPHPESAEKKVNVTLVDLHAIETINPHNIIAFESSVGQRGCIVELKTHPLCPTELNIRVEVPSSLKHGVVEYTKWHICFVLGELLYKFCDMETGTEHYKYCTVSMQQSPHTVLWTTNTVHAVSMYHRDPILWITSTPHSFSRSIIYSQRCCFRSSYLEEQQHYSSCTMGKFASTSYRTVAEINYINRWWDVEGYVGYMFRKHWEADNVNCVC